MTATPQTKGGLRKLGLRWFLRIRVRLLIVNWLLVLVPVVGLEFARVYERQLLISLERDMQNQATLLAQVLLSDLARDIPLHDMEHERALMQAAKSTRTRIRILDRSYAVLCDSHRNGPPEGREPNAPLLTRGAAASHALFGWSVAEGPDVPLEKRKELNWALLGRRATSTRLRANPPAVLLFLAQPIQLKNEVIGAVYVTRSTQPVLVELHRIRSGLIIVLAVTLAASALVTLLLAWSLISPIERLARAARKIAAGELLVSLPQGGGGELTELSRAISEMTLQLQARHRYVTDFAADVAHAFKSPLTSIRGAAELLEDGAADDPAGRARFLRNILADSERLNQLVTRLLELSRVEASDELRQELSLDEVIRRAIASRESPENCIEYIGGKSLPIIRGRARDIETALINLIDNAQRYGPPKVAVSVTVRVDESSEMLGVAVADRGPGIAPEHQGKVFERFFTTEANTGGTGLGLAIVEAVARAHGGTVTLESAVGDGATFVLWLSSARQ